MQRISITNPQNIIDGTAKKYYFKLRNTGGPKGDKGDKGDTGQTGPQGPKGDAATVAVGSTTTLAVGQDATVENVGSIYNAVLNFGIPQGPQGPQGAKGDKGDTGAQGETGPRGPQGERGTNATVYIGTTSTLNPGSQATVYNSGTDSNAVLNFGIPKGEKGDTGPMPTIAQTTGQAIDQVMSQKATTDALAAKQATISSSNKLSADLVDDTSTTNKFVTAQDKTNWNAKQDALTAGNNIDITDGVISTTAIAPEVVAELPATGTEGKLYLTPKAHTTQTATGNPITATVAEDAGAIESFQLDGDTFQQSYTGKNLLGFTLSAAGGLTASANPDGTINFSGTTSSAWPQLTSPFMLENTIPSGTELTFSITEPLPNNATLWLRVYESASSTTFSQIIIAANTTSKTAIIDRDFAKAMLIIGTSSGAVFDVSNLGLQLEKSSSATSYEPYVGGVPSPNPDYPQAIQTVTGEQTVTVVGKNLAQPLDKYTYDRNGSATIKSQSNDTVVFSTSTSSVSSGVYIYKTNGNNATLCPELFTAGYTVSFDVEATNTCTLEFGVTGNHVTSTISTTKQRVSVATATGAGMVFYNNSQNGATITISNIQVEAGSTASAYSPYSKQTLPLDLGSIELCKLGTYQDYIYKDGEDWKIRKRVLSIIMDGNTSITPNQFGTNSYAINVTQQVVRADTQLSAVSKYFYGIKYDDRTQEILNSTFIAQAAGQAKVIILRNTGFTTPEALSSWFDTYRPKFYCTATSADTTITDTDLIAQLEAIRTASLQNGANTITNTATGSNLAGDMEISYYGFAPRNRYDKWLWLDLNNNYEQIGS